MKSYYVAVMLLCAAQSMQGDGFVDKVKVALNNPEVAAIPFFVGISSAMSALLWHECHGSLTNEEVVVAKVLWVAPTLIGVLTAAGTGGAFGVYGIGRGMFHFLASASFVFNSDEQRLERSRNNFKSALLWTASGMAAFMGYLYAREVLFNVNRLLIKAA